MFLSISPMKMAGLPAGSAAAAGTSPSKIQAAAREFEALLIGQLLKGAQSEDSGWLGNTEDAGSVTAMDFANEYLARCLAAKGGLGLSRMIGKSLEHAASSSSHGTPDPARTGTLTPES